MDALMIQMLAALRHAQSSLYKAGHHHGISGTMIEVDNAITAAELELRGEPPDDGSDDPLNTRYYPALEGVC